MYLEQNKGGLPYSELPRNALEVLSVLPDGLDVDVSFNRTDCFKETPEIILLRYLDVPIYHGWLPDPDVVGFAALSSYTYSSLSIEASDDAFQNVDQARKLLTGSQFTSNGLRCLHNDLKVNVPCVLFWHNHCSTLIKVKEHLYVLVTDSYYIGTPVVWETLTLEGSGVLVDGDFVPVAESNITLLDQPSTMSVYPPFAPPDQLVSQVSSERVSPTTAQWPATNLTSNKGDDTDYVGSLEEYAKIPGNHFAEKKNLSALGTSLEVADTRKIGRIIARDLLLQIIEGHKVMVSWNGKFDRKSILVRSGFHTMLTAWINAAYGEFSDAAILNDYTTYVNEVLSLFEVKGVGYPAFFNPLIKTLKEESGRDTRSEIQFSNFCHKVEGHLALKFSLARADFFGGINKIRKHAPRKVRRELRRVLRQTVLIDGKDWRFVISGSGHHLLRTILRHRREGDNNGGNEEDFGYFLSSIDSASQFARQVNEHADDDPEVKDDAEDGDKEEDLGALSELEASDDLKDDDKEAELGALSNLEAGVDLKVKDDDKEAELGALSNLEAGDDLKVKVKDDDKEAELGALSNLEAGDDLKVKVKDDDKEAKLVGLSNLDLLYSHYLELPLAKAHEQILTSDVHDDLHDWLNDVLELFERPEIN
ncbi:uncharacterized protein [Triticum aestivum]|uniref:uncharacterized protein isoform X2 n=1 Tax=Triticum aestivum TaxID=4565 RepID=UPI001D030882|nr:uncharacterized protein LOC123136644 isoform X2 [Triticum aestivum]